MEEFLSTASQMWDKFADGGAYAIRKFFFALNGWEMSELLSLVLFIGAVGGLLLMLLLLAKRPAKRTTFLSEGVRRYHNH